MKTLVKPDFGLLIWQIFILITIFGIGFSIYKFFRKKNKSNNLPQSKINIE